MNKPVHSALPRPQDDYFGYINNTWIAENPIPASESMWGTFYVLRDKSWTAVDKIVRELSTSDPSQLTRDQRLLGSFFASALQYARNTDNQQTTLDKELANIAAISDNAALARYLGEAEAAGYNHFFSIYVDLDDYDSRRQVLRIHQSGLQLPNRDYYLDDSDDMQRIRSEYKQHYERVMQHTGNQTIQWQTVFDIELAIAKASWTDVALRDVEKNYTAHTQSSLRENITGFDWDNYFAGLGWQTPSDHLVVNQPDFLQAMVELMNTTPLADIKSYLSWRVINRCLSQLSEPAADINFEFFGKVLGGTTEQKPLWKRAVLQADRLIISEALGREYAARHFPESSKQTVLGLVEDVRAAYHKRIDRLTWMSDETKVRAHGKLDAISVFIGYPSVWKDLRALEFKNDDYLGNVLAARRFENALELSKVGQPPAEEDWGMSAHTVNAYHHPNRLEIVFPAAILQAPFFDPGASYAANLGGIGAVIGHEFTHGFDDQGAQFDEHGNVKAWQNEAERQAFKNLAQNIVKQADAFETVPGVYLQGELILGEAIADVGGLELALEALHARDYSREDEVELLEAFARAECGHATKERLIELARIDPHPPSRFRVNAVVGHVNTFYDVYELAPGDALYLDEKDRARIW